MASKFTTTWGEEISLPSANAGLDEVPIPLDTIEISGGDSLQNGTIIIGSSGVYNLSAMLNIKTFTGIGVGIIECRLMINDEEQATNAFQEEFLSPTQPTFSLSTTKTLSEGDEIKVVVYQTTEVPLICDWAEINLLKV